MFESDDYDEVLSEIDFAVINPVHSRTSNRDTHIENMQIQHTVESKLKKLQEKNISTLENIITSTTKCDDNSVSSKHTKRKLIDKHFDHRSKRKFPGPAGLLTGAIKEKDDEPIYQIELLSQDIDYSYNRSLNDIHETALWKRLEEDTKSLNRINTIKAIKNQALAGNLQSKKAEIVRAFVEAIDNSAIDPLITIRDATGNIKCTLHRDAWTHFSTYIVSQYCALVLYKPTVLTTGSAFKKHYLNITLSNISAIYSSTMISENEQLPDGFTKISEDDYTVVKTDTNLTDISQENNSINEDLKYLEDLDNVFADAF